MDRVQLNYDHLLNRPYDPEDGHCLALARDFFADNFDIEIDDYAIPHDWDADRLDMIEAFYEQEGFLKVQDWTLKTLRPGDVLCVAVRSQHPNHFAIYVGENKILHQPLYQNSRVELLRDFWRMATCFVIRHPAVPDLTVKLPLIELSEVLRARHPV